MLTAVMPESHGPFLAPFGLLPLKPQAASDSDRHQNFSPVPVTAPRFKFPKLSFPSALLLATQAMTTQRPFARQRYAKSTPPQRSIALYSTVAPVPQSHNPSLRYAFPPSASSGCPSPQTVLPVLTYTPDICSTSFDFQSHADTAYVSRHEWERSRRGKRKLRRKKNIYPSAPYGPHDGARPTTIARSHLREEKVIDVFVNFQDVSTAAFTHSFSSLSLTFLPLLSGISAALLQPE